MLKDVIINLAIYSIYYDKNDDFYNFIILGMCFDQDLLSILRCFDYEKTNSLILDYIITQIDNNKILVRHAFKQNLSDIV